MKLITWALIAVLALFHSNAGHAETAQEILEAAWDAQLSRWDGLDSYLVEQLEMGQSAKRYFVRSEVSDAAGNSRTMFLPAPDGGLGGGCVNPASAAEMAAGQGDMSAEYMSWFMESAELIGEESVDDTDAWQLRANDIDRAQTLSSEDISISAMTMWLSKDRYLPLKMRMEGTVNVDSQSRPVTIEVLTSDFRAVPGSQLLEPFRRVVSISGITTGIDESQIAEAKAAMAEFEQQMASMPASQRQMMKSMMGPQLEQLRELADSGTLNMEIVVESITANPEVSGERVVACDPG